jgi:crotonobetainyl-CoA:carnitine CoA-transferase CaiB-like acyl-CoA transferase
MHPVLGSIEIPGMPYRATDVEKWTNRPAPTFGEHTIEVLTEAGFDQGTLHDLVQSGVLSDRPRGV